MGITATFADPFFTGTATPSALVPGTFPVGLNGRGFLLDLESDQFRHQSIPLLRQQADQSAQPGEASINPDDLWRRVVSSWHKGAGQRNFDADESDPARFYTSKGIDPWTQGELRLLADVDEKKASSNTNLRLAVAGTYLYLMDGTSLQHTQDVSGDSPTWTDITGESATAGTALTSDGYTVYSAHGSDGVYVTIRAAGSTAKGVTGTVNGLKWVKGRLFGWADDDIYNITTIDTGTPSALPSSLVDVGNSDFDWVDVAEAGGFYFLAGYSGDKSLIYQTSVKDDGTGLEAVLEAAALPDGEIVRSVHGYLGFLLIGTDKGIRFASPDGSGNLTLGGLITDATDVRCFEGQDRFVWFGWSQFDATSTGLGRIDLSVFNGVRPAYASDLMASEDGDVLSVVTFGGRQVFAVSGDGIFAGADSLVASGTFDVGRISYGLYDPKVSMFVTVNHEPLAGSIAASMSRDGSDFATLGGESSTAASVRSDFPTNRARAESFDLRFTLGRDDGDATDGPVVGRITLRSYPAAARSERITVPLLLGRNQRSRSGASTGRDAIDDLEFLALIEADGSSVTYQEGSMSFPVIVEDHIWLPHHLEDNGRAFAGTYIVQLKRFASE